MARLSGPTPGVAVPTGAFPALPPELAERLAAVAGADGVITDPGALLVYESDALAARRARPRAVVFPRDTEETAAVLKLLAEAALPFVPRGAGTGLSGGALPLEDAVVVSTARMTGILELDAANRWAWVQPGVVNVRLSAAAAAHGLHYAPDPSSQTVCTIGGNVAENAGGPHCLAYGVTANHILGLTVVLADGEVVQLGGAAGEHAGYDLVGLFVGSEGQFGIATKIQVRLTPLPEGVETLLALFDHVDDASRAVSAIIAEGMVPAALEMVDREAIRAVEASVYAAGLPDVAGALVVELDGPAAGLDHEVRRVMDILQREGATGIRRAADAAERTRLWNARKKAFGAMGRLAPDILVQDAVVPRSRLPEVLAQAYAAAAREGILLCNTFHAGDGNLHPTLVFDRRDPDQVARVERASAEIMKACIAAGGTITGEHGVGIDKREYMELLFPDTVLEAMCAVRRVFDPSGRANPLKVLPVRVCREWAGPGTHLASDDARADTARTAAIPPGAESRASSGTGVPPGDQPDG